MQGSQRKGAAKRASRDRPAGDKEVTMLICRALMHLRRQSDIPFALMSLCLGYLPQRCWHQTRQAQQNE